MLVLYARRPDAIGTAGMIAAAFALAVQPDRAMAGVLVAGLLGLLAARGRSRLAVAGGGCVGRGVRLDHAQARRLFPPSPYVDQILYTAFDVHEAVRALVRRRTETARRGDRARRARSSPLSEGRPTGGERRPGRPGREDGEGRVCGLRRIVRAMITTNQPAHATGGRA